MFNNFIQNKVLSECEQFSEPHSVLCMNNCRIHHSEIGFHTDISLFANPVNRNLQLCVMRSVSFLHIFLSTHQIITLLRSHLVS